MKLCGSWFLIEKCGPMPKAARVMGIMILAGYARGIQEYRSSAHLVGVGLRCSRGFGVGFKGLH